MDTPDQSNVESSPLSVLREVLGGATYPGAVSWPGRRDPLLSLLARLNPMTGRARLQLDAEGCRLLISALNSRWRYMTVNGKVSRDLPVKDHPASDLGDARGDRAPRLPASEGAAPGDRASHPENLSPFLNQVATIAAKAKASIPAQVQGWLSEMDVLCESVPRQVRAGIDGWDTLSPPIWKDGKSIDVAVRGSLVHGIRTLLNSWDGCLTRLKDLTARVEAFIAESGWPSNQAGSTTIASAPARDAEEIQVET